jgi:gas vesicle protein GvpA/GvpJ/GvpM family
MTDNGNRGVPSFLNGSRPEGRRLAGTTQAVSSNLADLLERVLDKGIIIAGDITLCLGEIELLQIKIRLLIASVDKAHAMGIDWWQHDPALSSKAQGTAAERSQLLERLERLEKMLTPVAGDHAKEISMNGRHDAHDHTTPASV